MTRIGLFPIALLLWPAPHVHGHDAVLTRAQERRLAAALESLVRTTPRYRPGSVRALAQSLRSWDHDDLHGLPRTRDVAGLGAEAADSVRRAFEGLRLERRLGCLGPRAADVAGLIVSPRLSDLADGVLQLHACAGKTKFHESVLALAGSRRAEVRYYAYVMAKLELTLNRDSADARRLFLDGLVDRDPAVACRLASAQVPGVRDDAVVRRLMHRLSDGRRCEGRESGPLAIAPVVVGEQMRRTLGVLFRDTSLLDGIEDDDAEDPRSLSDAEFRSWCGRIGGALRFPDPREDPSLLFAGTVSVRLDEPFLIHEKGPALWGRLRAYRHRVLNGSAVVTSRVDVTEDEAGSSVVMTGVGNPDHPIGWIARSVANEELAVESLVLPVAGDDERRRLVLRVERLRRP